MKARFSLWLTSTLWLIVLALLAAVSLRHDVEIDLTSGQRNSLQAASQALLHSLDGPVAATAYVYADIEARREIRSRFAAYLREKPDFSLRFVDPASEPQLVRELGIRASGEIVLEYQERQERLSSLSEPEITTALQRLAHAGAARIIFLIGHGERDPKDDAQAGYQALATLLRKQGLDIESRTLATDGLPSSADLVILAAPRQSLLAGERAQLLSYLESGASLLWLTDPELPAIPELSQALGLEIQRGTLIYQDYELLGTGHPALALVSEYPAHPVTRGFKELSAFPLSGGLATANSPNTGNWHVQPLLQSVKRAWLEHEPDGQQLVFDPQQERYGPITLGLSLQRPAPRPEDPARQQKVVVIADSDFAANAYLNQLGNRAFSLRLIQWLIGRDAGIEVELPSAPDRQLRLSPLHTRIIAAFFVLFLPLGLLGGGLGLWYQRRHRR